MFDPGTCLYETDDELRAALSPKLKFSERKDASMLPFQGKHPVYGLKARRYMGREPAAYGALRKLRELGEMSQADFMREYIRCGATPLSNGHPGSFLNNFRRFVVDGVDVAQSVKNISEWIDAARNRSGEMYRWHPHLTPAECLARAVALQRSILERCIEQIPKMLWDHTGRVKVRNPDWPGASRGGNVLRWTGPSPDPPDWRPDFVIPEDSYAL